MISTLIDHMGALSVFVFALVVVLILFPLLLQAARGIWSRPSWAIGAAILALAVPWRSGAESSGLVHITLSDLISLIAVSVIAARFLVYREWRRLPGWIAIYLSALTVSFGVATMLSHDAQTSLSGLVRYLQIYVLVPLAVFYAVKTRQDRMIVIGSTVLLGLFQAALGLSQYITGTGAGFGSESVRAVGTFGSFNIMAYPTVVSLALISCIGVWIARPHLGIALVGPIAVLTAGLAVSLSRGVWLATAAGIGAMLVITGTRRAIAVWAVSGLLIVSGIAATGGPIAERALGFPRSVAGQDASVVDRYAMWDAGIGMFLERPVFGNGPKSFQGLRDSFAPIRFSGGSDISDPVHGYRRVELTTPHNLYVLTLVETGLIGAICLFSLLAGLLLRTLSRIHQRERQSEASLDALGFMAFGWLVSFLVAGLYGDVGGPIMALVGIMMGATMLFASGQADRHGDARPRPSVVVTDA